MAGLRLTALAPVAAAAGLMSFCVAGTPLYTSSSGSAAFADQFAETCRSESALILGVPDLPTAATAVAEIAADVPHLDAPRRITTGVARLTSALGPARRLTLVDVAGVSSSVTPELPTLGPGEIAVSRTNLSELATTVGSRLPTESGKQLTVVAVFDDLTLDPIPEFWCGFRPLFVPTAGGDPPPPSAIASAETIAGFGATTLVEYRVTTDPLTLTDADRVQRGFAEAHTAWAERFPSQRDPTGPSEFPRVYLRADAVALTVERSIAPVLLTAITAVTVVLAACAVLLARSWRRRLRLMALRGIPPWRVALGIAGPVTGALVIGSAVGYALAYLGVVWFGPSSTLERSAIERASASVVASAVLAVPFVAGVVSVVGDRWVDRGERRLATWIVPGLLLMALWALVAVAFSHLDREGGIRTFGVESRGGDLLSMGFALFLLLAVTALAGAVVAWATPRLRLTGGRLRRAVRLGWRRVVLEPAPVAAVVVAVALATGCLTTSRALADASVRQLSEKADVYVGSDLAVTIYDEPPRVEELVGSATVLHQTKARAGEQRVDLVGVDTRTFADVARLRGDASARDLRQLVDALTGDAEPIPAAIAVGTGDPLGAIVEVTATGAATPTELRVVESLTFFPGKSSGAGMYVVARPVVDAAVAFPVATLLVRDPPTDVFERLHDAGVRTGLVRRAGSAFDGSAYSALRWAYTPLAVLGVLFAALAIAFQLLVIAARATPRRAAHVVMRRQGFTSRSVFLSAAIETAVPLLAGVVVGALASTLAGALAVPRLDPMPSLQPPATFAYPWMTLTVLALLAPLWALVVAGLITRSTISADPMEVMHGEL